MKMQIRIWESLWTGWCYSTNFLSVETGKVLSHVQEGPNNRLECLLSFESHCNYVFSFDIFCQKLQVCFWWLCAASLFLGLGLCSCIYVEWIRLTIQAQSPCIHVLEIWFFHIFFNPFSIEILPNLDDFVPLRRCTKSLSHVEGICCIKRFERHDLVFFSYLILIKWINNNKNSNN